MGIDSVVIVVLYGEGCVLFIFPRRKGSFQDLTAESGSNRPWNRITYLSMELSGKGLSIPQKSITDKRPTVLTSPSAA